ncbi:MAG: hypothetical protein ACFFD4_40300 [Candidatus Odinarchaeota archaeon]
MEECQKIVKRIRITDRMTSLILLICVYQVIEIFSSFFSIETRWAVLLSIMVAVKVIFKGMDSITREIRQYILKRREMRILRVRGGFTYLQFIHENWIVDLWPEVLDYLKYGDALLALEAEQVLKELLPEIDVEKRKYVEYQIEKHGKRIVKALSESRLL